MWLGLWVRAHIHTLMRDAHDLDHTGPAVPVEDAMGADCEREIARLNMFDAASLQCTALQTIEAFGQRTHISISLVLVPAFGGIGPDAGEITTRGG
ncbi:hypothetical protein AKJ13_11035 [Methylobacterium sp. ARG-1]|nr:hypothetical protein AKJ13_11035 [Methylobacterium sp. ARG-1]